MFLFRVCKFQIENLWVLNYLFNSFCFIHFVYAFYLQSFKRPNGGRGTKLNTMAYVLERTEICLSFPVELSICGFLYVSEYIVELWSLKQILIKSNGRLVWKAFTFKFEFFKRKELTVENQNIKVLYISLSASTMQIELNHLLTQVLWRGRFVIMF